LAGPILLIGYRLARREAIWHHLAFMAGAPP
jgi:hypothetical protein